MLAGKCLSSIFKVSILFAFEFLFHFEIFSKQRLNYSDFTNLALGKTAYQSSNSYSGVPEKAVDGNHTNYHKRSCGHTTNTEEPWWTVDLENETLITDVAITNS